MTILYFNSTDRYGDMDTPVTVEDYRAMDPESEFEETVQWGMDVIVRRLEDANNPFEVVAVGYNSEADDSQFDNRIERLPAHIIDYIKSCFKD